jgi:hypothetical protein
METMAKRTAIGKQVRFEVFKRDSFKCQYCGAAAPDVLLHIDHIKPVSAGGTNEITNLLTACVSCNLGKSDRQLDDTSAVVKQRAQLEELQERREQLEMMMEWKQGLNALKEDIVSEVCNYWEQLAPGFDVNDNGRRNIQKWLRSFRLDEVLHAMDVAAEQYLRFAADQAVTSESWEYAFSKVPGICRVERASAKDPELRDLYYIRGIARNNCPNYFNPQEALELLKIARSWEVEIDELRAIAVQARNWTQFRNALYDAIDRQRELLEPPGESDAGKPRV